MSKSVILGPDGKPSKAKDVVSKYTHRFGIDDDQSTVTEEQRKQRQDHAAEVADEYYNIATFAYESNWSTHFHYTPFFPSQPIAEAMAFYAHKLAYTMGLKPHMKVLDVGCGIGGPAREIAKFIGCEIIGITINQHQVDRARMLTREVGLEDKVAFVQADFLNLPFPPSSFDAAYAIEATCHAPSLVHVYKQIRRILKPCAPFASAEWALISSKYDPTNSAHIGIRNRIERGNGISNLQTSDSCREALVTAGFTVECEEDYSLHWASLGKFTHRPVIPGFTSTIPSPISTSSSSAPIPVYRPWFYPLLGALSMAPTWTDYWITFKLTRTARFFSYWVVWILQSLRLYPQGTTNIITTLAYCIDSVVEGGREGVFTPGWWFICRNEGSGMGEREGMDEDEREAKDDEGDMNVNECRRVKEGRPVEEVISESQGGSPSRSKNVQTKK